MPARNASKPAVADISAMAPRESLRHVRRGADRLPPDRRASGHIDSRFGSRGSSSYALQRQIGFLCRIGAELEVMVFHGLPMVNLVISSGPVPGCFQHRRNYLCQRHQVVSYE
jgi:hypothetical protein